MKVLLDVNVVLDLLLRRNPWVAEATAIWGAHEQGLYDVCIAAITPGTAAHAARREIGTERARELVRRFLLRIEICTMDKAVLEAAGILPITGDEDAIQHAAAQAVGVEITVTRDRNDFAGATLPVLAPVDFLRQIAPR